MKTLVLTTALAVTLALAGSASAQSPSGTTRPQPWMQSDAAYPPPPGQPPAGMHYEWVFSYDHHANYLGHWQLVRNN